jgi:transcription elongation GreA/GreB family factor
MSATPMDHNTAPLITREGYEHLRAEIARLCDARPEMIERLRGARDNGNLDDNPTLYEVLEEQAQLERRIAQLRGRLAAAAPVGRAVLGARAGEVVDVATPRGNVQLEVLEVRAISARKAA